MKFIETMQRIREKIMGKFKWVWALSCNDSFVFIIKGCFKPGENGTILKKSTDKERECLVRLMKDILRPYIPEYKKEVNKGGERILSVIKWQNWWSLVKK